MSCCKTKNQTCNIESNEQSDYLVCTCMGVMYSDISDAIDQGARSFSELSEQLGVGTGCSSCVAEVEAILELKKQKKCCKR